MDRGTRAERRAGPGSLSAAGGCARCGTGVDARACCGDAETGSSRRAAAGPPSSSVSTTSSYRAAGIVTVTRENILAQIDSAARHGARVINLSLGIDYHGAVPGSLPRHGELVQTTGREFRLLVARLDSAGFRPLFVIGAGNDGNDARWSGFPTLRTHDPSRALVVAAVRRSGPNVYEIRPNSNRGNLVEVAAPGEDVLTVDNAGSPIAYHATSIAAPHVSGLATLLFSFDPRLTPPEVNQLILDGAEAGSRHVNGTFFLTNAYESVKVAARRSGTPLCGNRLWMQDGTLHAQRDTASQTGESLFTVATSTGTSVSFNALHGGKHVHLYTAPATSRTARRWRVSSTGAAEWVQMAFESAPAGTNASFYSRDGRSHDGDTTVFLTATYTGPYEGRVVEFTPEIRRTADGSVLTAFSTAIRDTVYESAKVCPQFRKLIPPGRE